MMDQHSFTSDDTDHNENQQYKKGDVIGIPTVRGLPANIKPEDEIWCVSGEQINTHTGQVMGAGVIEWCYDRQDAADMLIMLRTAYPRELSGLVAHKYDQKDRNLSNIEWTKAHTPYHEYEAMVVQVVKNVWGKRAWFTAVDVTNCLELWEAGEPVSAAIKRATEDTWHGAQ